jgi:hypothetical protein
MLAAQLQRRLVEDTGGNSNGVGTDNNQQGCGSGVGSGCLPPLSSYATAAATHTGGNSNGVGTDNNQQGCGSRVALKLIALTAREEFIVFFLLQ